MSNQCVKFYVISLYSLEKLAKFLMEIVFWRARYVQHLRLIRHPGGSPRHTVESDLHPTTVNLHTAWRRAQDRPTWRTLVETTTLQHRG